MGFVFLVVDMELNLRPSFLLEIEIIQMTTPDLWQRIDREWNKSPVLEVLNWDAAAPEPANPELILEESEGQWNVRTDSSSLPCLRVSPHYRRALEDEANDPRLIAEMRRHVDRAEALVNAIDKRQLTLQGIAEALVDGQREFFQHRADALKPLAMQDIADCVGVHVSTVSRAISGKSMQTPRGVIRLREFFLGSA